MLGRLSRLFTTPTVSTMALVSAADIHFYSAHCLTSQIRSRWHSRLQQHTVGSYTTTWQKYCEKVSNFQETNSWWVLKWKRVVAERGQIPVALWPELDCFLSMLSVYISPPVGMNCAEKAWCAVSTANPPIPHPYDLSSTKRWTSVNSPSDWSFATLQWSKVLLHHLSYPPLKETHPLNLHFWPPGGSRNEM